MNRKETAVLVFLLLTALPSAIAQNPEPNAKASVSAAAPPQVATKPPTRARAQTGPDADARICLEFPTAPEVIMCAEKYRPHKPNA